MTLTCPKCGRIINDPSGECSNCGLNYNEYVKKRDKRKAEIMKKYAGKSAEFVGTKPNKLGKTKDKPVRRIAMFLTLAIWVIGCIAIISFIIWLPTKPDTQQTSKTQQAKPETSRKSQKKSSSWGQCSTELERNVCLFILEAFQKYDKIRNDYPPGYEREKYVHRLKNLVTRLELEVSHAIGPVNSQNEQVSSQIHKLCMAFRMYIILMEIAEKNPFTGHNAFDEAFAERDKVLNYCETCLK